MTQYDDTYSDILDQTHVRDFHVVDARGDELLKLATWSDDNTALVVLHRRYGREPGMRTVTLCRSEQPHDNGKLRVTSDAFYPQGTPAYVDNRPTRPVVKSTVPRVTPSVSISGNQVDKFNLNLNALDQMQHADENAVRLVVAEILSDLRRVLGRTS